MRTLAVLSRKGGTGKTTVALHLAVASQHERRRTLVADMDPQRSSMDWRRERLARGPQVIEVRPGALFAARQTALREDTSLLVLDTRPASDNETAEAVRFADLCLMVVRPSFFDIKAIARTAEMVSNMGRKGIFLINQAPSRRGGEEPRQVRETLDALLALGFPVTPVGLRYRSAYQNAVQAGRAAQEVDPDNNAAFEINLLWRHLKAELWPKTKPVAVAATRATPVGSVREVVRNLTVVAG